MRKILTNSLKIFLAFVLLFAALIGWQKFVDWRERVNTTMFVEQYKSIGSVLGKGRDLENFVRKFLKDITDKGVVAGKKSDYARLNCVVLPNNSCKEAIYGLKQAVGAVENVYHWDFLKDFPVNSVMLKHDFRDWLNQVSQFIYDFYKATLLTVKERPMARLKKRLALAKSLEARKKDLWTLTKRIDEKYKDK